MQRRAAHEAERLGVVELLGALSVKSLIQYALDEPMSSIRRVVIDPQTFFKEHDEEPAES
eukprot:COSAG06_NODE_17569_length_933_cov_2.500000_2_plen_60_part_00